MDSWRGSFISGYHWKWIYNLPRLQQTKSPHQKQRVYCITCSSRFLCWFEWYSFSVFCDITNTCPWPDYWFSWVNIIRLFSSHTSALNLCALVLDRFIAVVYPLKYITLMTRRRITQAIFFSWALPVSYNALKDTVCLVLFQNDTTECPFIWPTIISEFLPCVVLILCFVSMIFHVCRHDQSACTLAKQLRFNHQVSFKTHREKSAVIMMDIVIGVFLACYGIYPRGYIYVVVF